MVARELNRLKVKALESAYLGDCVSVSRAACVAVWPVGEVVARQGVGGL